ncbi:hypothetical protein [Halopenitus salinus]|uniref:hypothetical protein n=1 Tax=Halopenitus salinus TaxID=1198295 RepID=UPI0036D259C8
MGTAAMGGYRLHEQECAGEGQPPNQETVTHPPCCPLIIAPRTVSLLSWTH